MFALLISTILIGWLLYLTNRVRELQERLDAVVDAGVPAYVPFEPAYAPEPVHAPDPVDYSVAEPAARPSVAPLRVPDTAPPAFAVAETEMDLADEDEVAAPARGSLFEDMFGRRLPIWAGGITLAVAAVFMVRYSIENGLLPPIARVLAGFSFGIALVAVGEAARRMRLFAADRRVSQALAGAGIAACYVSILAALRLYALVGPFAGFLGLAGVTGAAMLLALRFGAPCAVLGLIGGLAAPALVGASEPNVPGMALYLMLVVGGLSGVARREGWLWLSACALIGGFGWAALLMLGMIDTAAGSATGVLLLALALGLPLFATRLPNGGILRLASLAIGAVEIALLVARGGYAPLEWAFYGLLGIGAVVLARLDRRCRAMPPIALAVALGTVASWPMPAPMTMLAVLGGIIAILALPALIEAPHPERGWTSALQGAAALCLVPLLAWIKLPMLLSDSGWALTCLAFASAAAIAAHSVWKAEDARFAALASAAAALTVAAAILALPLAALPSAFAAIACVGLGVARIGEDMRLAGTSRLIGALAPLAAILFLFDGPATLWSDLGLAGAALGFACAGHIERARDHALPWLIAAPLLAGVALYHQLPASLLAASFATAAAGLMMVDRDARFRPVASAVTFAAMAAILVAIDATAWFLVQAPALAGISVDVSSVPGTVEAVLRLALPGLLLAFCVHRAAPAAPLRAGLLALPVAAVTIALHILYRHGFAHVGLSGGTAERVLLTSLLLGAGLALDRRYGERWQRIAVALLGIGLARAVWFELGVDNPLWTHQSVGALPLLNWLAPAYLLPAAIMLIARGDRRLPDPARKLADAIAMLLLIQFVAAGVRQLFHGAILDVPGVTAGENAMRSLAGIATAIGFLLYGLRQKAAAWRITGLVLMILTMLKVFLIDAAGLDGLLRILSFVALGLSLIGIGWLHNRLSAQAAS